MLFRVIETDWQEVEPVEINTLEELKQFQIDNGGRNFVIDFDPFNVNCGAKISYAED